MMPTVEYKELLGAHAGKRIEFTEVTSFSELFSEWEWFYGSGYANQDGVSDYCNTTRIDLPHSLNVKARPHLVTWITSNMLLPEYDSWYFELVHRDDGILVVVKNNQILASRWLALLDTKTTLSEIEND